MNQLSSAVKKFQEQIDPWQSIKTENLRRLKPEFTLRFGSASSTSQTHQPPVVQVPLAAQTAVSQLTSKCVPLNIKAKTEFQQTLSALPVNVAQVHAHEADFKTDERVFTSYCIDRMASDGDNIMYASYFDNQDDILAYCLLDNPADNADAFRSWKQSRIEDMIWWESIQRFICATHTAIHTIDHTQRRFKIGTVLRGKWSYARIAANTNNFFLDYVSDNENSDDDEPNDGVLVYTNDFQLVRRINTTDQKYYFASSSFCVTDYLLASISTRKLNNRQVMQVNIFDFDMRQLTWMNLGSSDESIETRTNGQNQFFITTGKKKLHIVKFDAIQKKLSRNSVDLADNAACIAVLGGQRLALSHARLDMELVTYWFSTSARWSELYINTDFLNQLEKRKHFDQKSK